MSDDIPKLYLVPPEEPPPGRIPDPPRAYTRLDVATRLDLDPDMILQEAIGQLESVVIIGYDKNDNEYFASSIAAGDTVVWLFERCKLKLLRMADDENPPNDLPPGA